MTADSDAPLGLQKTDGPFDPNHPRVQEIIDAYKGGGWPVGTELPHHSNVCYGCGPDNASGLGYRATTGAAPGETHGTYTFDDRYIGAPGLAHGGAVSALADDVFGFSVFQMLTLAVTRELTVSYRRPVRLGIPIEITTRLDDRDERELHFSASFMQNDIHVVEARATFRTVALEHFSPYLKQ